MLKSVFSHSGSLLMYFVGSENVTCPSGVGSWEMGFGMYLKKGMSMIGCVQVCWAALVR